MKKIHIGILFSMLVLGLCSACDGQKPKQKLVLNEVLVENESNCQDDYGERSGWIEIFNRSYGTTDFAGFYLKHSSQPGDTVTYFIPKGDVQTQIKPRQHALFWADGKMHRGTFHANFRLDAGRGNWVGLYDVSKQLVDEIVVPAGKLQANQSYARVNDASDEWEVKNGDSEKFVTPGTNNQVMARNAKREKFSEHDGAGVGMAVTAMGIVFCGLLLLFISFQYAGKLAIAIHYRNVMKSRGAAGKTEAGEKKKDHTPGEVYAAIAMAMHEMQNDVHDVEDTVLTITRVKRSYSPWSSKIYTLRETPHKK